METETRLELPAYQLANLKPSPKNDNQLDTVRALHQTVISLRTKLGSTENKLRRLRETVGGFSNREYVQLVQRLSLENHVLRRKIIDDHRKRTLKQTKSSKMEPEPEKHPPEKVPEEEEKKEEKMPDKKPVFEVTRSCASDDEDFDKDEKVSPQPASEKSPERLELADELSQKSVSEGNSALSDAEKAGESRKPSARESEDESEELDDIELIFTTEETCQNVGLQEDNLVSIEETCWPKAGRKLQKHELAKSLDNQTVEVPPLLKGAKTIDLAQELVCNGADKLNTSVDEAVSSQSSSIDREESIDRFDESSSTRLNKVWSQCSVLVETDISKCGVLEEEPSGDQTAKNSARRNTLAAPFMMAYRPIIHREALALNSRRKSSGAMTSNNTPLRPVVDYRTCGARRESGAQTDISALPAQWRSESYLAHKVAHTFTTLPSKFAFPTGLPGPGKLRLSEKTREARRVMLSDISFTSMVPELSRSADHLCQEPHTQACYNNNNSNTCSRSGIKTPENRRESVGSPSGYWTGRYNAGPGLPSPCECRHSSDLYGTRYQGSLSSIPSPGLEVCFGGPLRRHSWRAATNPSTTSFDALRIPSIATAAIATPTDAIGRCNWSCSMPSSPTHVHPPIPTRPANATRFIKHFPKRTRSKVTFQECPMSRGSLPNLRSELIGENSGDSTESLIDEAEDYLRRSIDSMLTMSVEQNWSDKQIGRRRRTRRYSEPDLFKEWNPPQDARPYLPKVPRDLKLDHLVKVISPEGKVLQGRVRYVGSVPGYEDTYVGVELLKDNGFSNGTFNGIRYFYCEPDRAVFVPFKKVVLAWCTT